MGKQKYPQATTVSADGEVTKRKQYSSLKSKARKAKRKQEALARQSEYNKLTTKQKITRAKSRPGDSKKEIARLKKLNDPNTNPR